MNTIKTHTERLAGNTNLTIGDFWDAMQAENTELRAEVERQASEITNLESTNVSMDAAIERLTTCLKFEQHFIGRVGTHGPNCYQWGPAHYQCAMVEIDRLKAASRRGQI